MKPDTRELPYYIVKPKYHAPEEMPFSVEYDKTIEILIYDESLDS